MEKEKVVCVLSGGLDSTTLVYDLVHQNFQVFPLSFHYKQKHVREIALAKKTCEKLGLEHKVLDLGVLTEVAPSALTRIDWSVPQGHYNEETMKQTIVPNRNMVMLSLATSYAISLDAKKLFYGAHAGDHHIYEDCRPEFVEAMKKSILLCDAKRIELIAPYSYMDKGDIVKRGVELGVDYSLTHTCYEGREKACGKCGSCDERLTAFKKTGLVDPIEYE